MARNITESKQDHGDVIASAKSRRKMRADWDTVRAMLTGASPRRDPAGRDVFQVWADLVLENPPREYERAMRLFPPEGGEKQGDNSVVTNIGQLYLQAVQMANREPDIRVVDAIGTKPGTVSPINWDD